MTETGEGHPLVVNGRGAFDMVEEETEPVVRELLRMSTSIAMMQFAKPKEMGDAEFQMRLPEAPFDMAFFVRVVQQMFRQRHTLEAILRGQSVAAASGWDIEGE
jgi:hypothetical protein